MFSNSPPTHWQWIPQKAERVAKEKHIWYPLENPQHMIDISEPSLCDVLRRSKRQNWGDQFPRVGRPKHQRLWKFKKCNYHQYLKPSGQDLPWIKLTVNDAINEWRCQWLVYHRTYIGLRILCCLQAFGQWGMYPIKKFVYMAPQLRAALHGLWFGQSQV